MLEIGQQLDGGRYTILQALGKGGAGSVYRVRDERAVPGFAPEYALKQFRIGEISDEQERADATADFRSEVRLLMSLRHPNITQIVNFFAESDSYFIVMDLVDGGNLNKALTAAFNRLPLATVLDWFWQTVDVLVYLHQHEPPIIFRDLKPGNIMVTKAGVIKLIDFGIARFFKRDSHGDTRALGTPGYAPPEQYGRSQTDERSDIYALGVTFWQLLTGEDPTENIFNLAPARTFNAGIPVLLEQLIARMTRMEPAERVQTMVEVRDALKTIYPNPVHPSPRETLLAIAPTSAADGPPSPAPTNPPPTPPSRGGEQVPAPATTNRIDARYLAPEPLPAVGAARKQKAERSAEPPSRSDGRLQPAPAQRQPVVADKPANSDKPATNKPAADKPAEKARRQGPLIPTFVLAMLLIGGVAFAFSAGYIQLPFFAQEGSGSQARPTVAVGADPYPTTVPPLPGVTDASYNSRSLPGNWSQAGYDWGRTNYSREANVLPQGTPVWTYTIPAEASFSLPLIGDGGLFMIAPDPVQGITSVVALRAEDGNPLWSFATSYNPSNPAPLAYASGDSDLPRLFYAGDNAIAAIDPLNNGKRVWAKEITGTGALAINSARPVLINGVIYAHYEGEARIDANSGNELDATVRDGAVYIGDLAASPDAAATYALLCASDKTSCSLIAENTSQDRRNPLWNVPNVQAGELLVTADTVYLGSDTSVLQAYDACDGSALWNSDLGGSGPVQMAIKGNILVAATDNARINALRAADGSPLWDYAIEGGQPAGAPLIVGDVVYATLYQGAGGSIVALDLRRGTLLKSYPTQGVPRSGPIYAGGLLYYVDSVGLHAIRLPPPQPSPARGEGEAARLHRCAELERSALSACLLECAGTANRARLRVAAG